MKFSIEIPDRATLLSGLSPHELHPQLARAEAAAAEAEKTLTGLRAERAERKLASVALGQARACVAAEQKKARIAVQSEVQRRAELLIKPAADAAAAVDELNKISQALDRVLHGR